MARVLDSCPALVISPCYYTSSGVFADNSSNQVMILKDRQIGPRITRILQLTVCALALLPLFWNLSERYLWQDEAHTGVLAQRVLRFGLPLAYDGKNLVGSDIAAPTPSEETEHTYRDPDFAVRYYADRGIYGPNLAWRFHPWGQFYLAASTIALLGNTTLAARLPFVLAGLAALWVLFSLAVRFTGSTLTAVTATLFLGLNSFWVLNARQARYYPVSSLMLLVTLLLYLCWRERPRENWLRFPAVTCLWFHFDFGTVLLVLAVLFADCMIFNPERRVAPRTWLVAALGILASLLFYQPWARVGFGATDWPDRLLQNTVYLDHYVVPLSVIAAALVVLGIRRDLIQKERRLIGLSCTILAALPVWLTMITPSVFLRYSIIAAPLGALVMAWTAVRMMPRRFALLSPLPVLAVALLPILVLPRSLTGDESSPLLELRPELSFAWRQIVVSSPDPNRIAVEWLRHSTGPDDPILINYEDLPLIYYLPNPVRGGIAGFRVEGQITPPAVTILRRTASFTPEAPFLREARRHRWQTVAIPIPDVPWGNLADPHAMSFDPVTARPAIVGVRIAP